MRFLTCAFVLVSLAILPAGLCGQDEAAEEAAAEPEPRAWTRNLGLSALMTSGNSETTSAGLNFLVKRRPQPWGVTFRGSALREESEDLVTAERYVAATRVERILRERWSAFASLRGEQDEPAGYELRTVTELGALYNLLTGPAHTLDTRMGLTYTTEKSTFDQDGGDDSDSFPGAVLGADYTWKIREGTSLIEALELFPNFDETDDWRLASALALQSDLSRLLALQVGLEIRYDNRPLVDETGTELDSTDTALTLSLVLGDRE